MKAHSWWNHTGQASTIPAVRPTLRRSMNWSNGAVASRRQPPSALMSARADGGSEQYGVRSHSPRLSMPNSEWLYQMKPMMVVSATAPIEISSRVRNSRTCSTSDMVPSGLARLRRARGSSLVRNRGVRTAGYLAAPVWAPDVLAGSGRTRCRSDWGRARELRPARRPPGRAGRERPRWGAGPVAAPGSPVRPRSRPAAPDLRFEDAHRLAQRPGRVGQPLRPEEQNADPDEDQPVPWTESCPFSYLQTLASMLPAARSAAARSP